MLVADLMTHKLITVAPDDSVEVAVQLLRQRGLRHLLVLKGERLVGIVSDRDIKRALDPGKTRKKLLNIGGLFFLLEPILVKEIMTPDPVTIAPDRPIQEAAALMVSWRFGALPVDEQGKTVGIVTETDLLRHFAKSGGEPVPEAGTPRPRKGRRGGKSRHRVSPGPQPPNPSWQCGLLRPPRSRAVPPTPSSSAGGVPCSPPSSP
jgi:acetoin utilization protein AcuB